MFFLKELPKITHDMEVIISTNLKVYNSVDFGMLVISGNHQLYLVPEQFHLLPKGKPVPQCQSLPIPLPPAPGSHTLLAFSVDLPVLDISYKLNHTTCVPLCLASLTQPVFRVHPHCSEYQSCVPCCARIAFHWMHRPHCVYPFTR